MRRLLLALVACLVAAAPARAQLTPPYTFINGTTADADQVNANFALLGNALNRTGGTMTGTLTSRNVVPDGNNTRDIGALGNVYANVYATTFVGAGTSLTGVALLASNNTFTATGTQALSASLNGSELWLVQNTNSGTGATASFEARNNSSNSLSLLMASSGFTPGSGVLADGARVLSNGAGGLSIMASNAAGDLRFYAGGTAIRWGINDAGDFTFGTSSNISDSGGTPNPNSCVGGGSTCTWAGQDYAIKLTTTGAPTTAIASFGHPWTTAPICTASSSTETGTQISVDTSTTVVSVALAAGLPAKVFILCRSY